MSEARSYPIELTRYGLDRYTAGDFELAAQSFQRVAEATPNAPLAWNNLSLPLLALGLIDQAVSVLQCSLDLDPAQPGIWTCYASALLQSGKSDEAEAASKQAIARGAVNATPWEICALACAGRENFSGAAAAFARTIEIAGETATLRANLGTMLFRCGEFHEAACNFTRAIDLDPTATSTDEMSLLCRLIVAALDNNIAAAWSFCAELPTAPSHKLATLFKTALLYLDNAGHRDAAVRVAERWVESQSDNIEARHLCDAACARSTDRWPAELLVQHFDELAEGFEDKLVGRLEYAGPKQIARLIAPHIPRTPTLDVLDIGCGTGLLGSSLRPFARRLAGVDLSTKMINKALARGLYDRLDVTDMMLSLKEDRQGWDLIVAADALPYFGPLASVFTVVADALRPGGWFAFSTESINGDSFLLRGSGRYAHSRDYVTTLVADHFEIVECFTSVLRREGGRPLEGNYFLLRRRELSGQFRANWVPSP
jgi:predicted TPR repeat methyltransferase